MAGRADYEERKKRKIERYKELSEKASNKSKEYFETHDKIANTIPMGQPIIVGHHSEGRHRRDFKKMDTAIEKSIAEDKKAEYYSDKVESMQNSNVISSDDPQAIEKLEQKLQALEKCKEEIKSREHQSHELYYMSAEIKRVKDRIKELKELEEIDFQDITFNGGKVIHNKDENRIQIIFDSIPTEDIRTILKRHGFKWARTQGAWQRLFNKNGIRAARYVLERIEKLGDETL